MEPILLDQDNLQIEHLVAIARNYATVDISSAGEQRVAKTRRLIAGWINDKKAMYGITTGIGALCDVPISQKDTRQLQNNILMSHAAGVGEPFPEDVVRATMALRVHDLGMGYSGCCIHTLQYLMHFLNHALTPVIPEKGSVGASGDLAPTAHLGLVLIGKGEAQLQGQRMSGAEALEKIGLKPLALEAGEGLALINGTQVMTAIAALVVHDAIALSKMADIACAMSLEVLIVANPSSIPASTRSGPIRVRSRRRKTCFG